jgi:thiamine-monophosphate kinase
VKLSQLGEFGLIDRIARHEKRQPGTVVGIGDDAAVIQPPTSNLKPQNKYQKIKYQLITTDTLVENVHFKAKGASFFKLGQKALAANISDIAAMGGWPTHALVTVGLPRTLSVKKIDDLYSGIDRLAKKHRIDIIGGDTVASSKAVVISITLLGEVDKENLLLRSGARPGDLICVTGKFGGPAAANYELRNLSRENRGITNYELRIREARIIAKSHVATSMIDSSDGLVRSVLEICRASKVGARIWESQVPVADGATLKQALYGGEEYELVFTVSPKARGQRPEAKGLRYKVVGQIVGRKSGVSLVDKRDKIKTLQSGGYEHFIK